MDEYKLSLSNYVRISSNVEAVGDTEEEESTNF